MGWNIFTGKNLVGIAGVSVLGVLLMSAGKAQETDVPDEGVPQSDAREPEDIQQCPGDQKVQLTCRLKGTLVKKFVCNTKYGRGVNDDLNEAVRIACQPP